MRRIHKKTKYKFLSLLIFSQKAESVPPLGTVLGNIGVNSTKFCKDFNDYTLDLPSYFNLRVNISISINKNYTFIVKMPTIGYILSILKKEEEIIEEGGYKYIQEYVELEDLLKLSKFKYPTWDLSKSLPVVMGTIKSTNLRVKI